MKKLLLVVALCGVVTAPLSSFAQPKTDEKEKAPAPGEDDALYSCKKKTGPVAVTFKPETELKDLIAFVMGFTCKNFILDPRIVSTGKKVTVIAPRKMSQQDAYRVFLVALSTMGLTVVPKGNILRIVESATAKSETIPIFKKGMPADEDQMVRYVLRPSYAQVETVRAALDSIRSPAGQVQAAGSMLIITDYASQVRDMMSLAKTIDVPGNNEGVYTIPVLHSDATALAAKLNEILGVTSGAGAGGGKVNLPPQGRGGGPAPAGAANAGTDEVAGAVPSKILVDDRTNTLIVVSSEAGYLRVKSLVERLDILLDTEGGSAIRVYNLENALAKDLATTLNTALSQGAQRQQPGAGGRPGATGAPPPPTPQPGGELGAALEGQVRVAHADTPKSLSVSSLATLTGLIGGLVGSPLTNSQTFLGTSIPSYAILFQALATQDNTNILSAPHIITIDNEKTEFSVGNNIPYQAGLSFGGLPTTGTTGGATSPLGSIGQNIQREKLTLDLNVTPHISSNDAVRLEIEQNTKDLGGKDPQLGPTWTERKLTTQVVVHDQESVVIGGLIQEREVYSVSKVPLLGDIPLLGYLF